MNEDPRHGLPSASKMDMIAHCPGCWQAQKHYSQTEETEVSKEGTKIHDAVHVENFDDLDETSAEIASRLVAMTERAHDAWLSFCKFHPGEPTAVSKEKRFWITDAQGNNICSAQIDWMEIAKGKALIIDYKTGYLDVTPGYRNHQIRTQAVAVWRNHPELQQIRGEVAAFRFREQASKVDYDVRTLNMVYREIQFILWRAEQPDAPRIPGAWCRYCRAKADCAECASFNAMTPMLNVQAPTD